MLDIKELRKNGKEIENLLKTKQADITLSEILKLDEEIRNILTKSEELKAQRNIAQKDIAAKKAKKEDATSLLKELSNTKEQIEAMDAKITVLEKEIKELMSYLPNIPLKEIPVSPDPKDNVCIKEFGKKKEFAFPFKNHLELNEKLKLFDFTRGVKIAGSNWPLYTDIGARLEWALINYMLQIHIKNGFKMVLPPLLTKAEITYGSGQLPKFAQQLFKIKDEDFNLYLIPTAEIPLNGLHYDEILHGDILPLKYTAYSPCFRREAGSAGKQERGLIRMHQFNKVEMFCFTKPEESEKIFQEMMQSAHEVLEGLELHYRDMLLCTGDMSFAAAKTVDIEVWLPGQNRYYEVSSVSNCTDFQARRSHTRFKNNEEDKTQFVHTLNGSGVATSRLMVSILENNQQADGSVMVPKVLRPFLGLDLLKP
jgi:seryl-tRNA synthetase